MLSGEVDEDIDKFIKIMLQCIIEQCNNNIKRIKRLNKVYKTDFEESDSDHVQNQDSETCLWLPAPWPYTLLRTRICYMPDMYRYGRRLHNNGIYQPVKTYTRTG